MNRIDAESETLIVASPLCAGYAKGAGHNDGKKGSPQNLIVGTFQQSSMDGKGTVGFDTNDIAKPVKTQMDGQMIVTHALKAEGFDASEDGTGRGVPLVPVAFSAKDDGSDALSDCSPTLRAGVHSESHANAGVMPAIAFAQNQRDEVREMPVVGALAGEPGMKQQTYVAYAIQERAVSENTAQGPGGKGYQPEVAYTLESRHHVQAVAKYGVRRLTPMECERLQGFQDGYTAIPGAADGPRYRALGNSMAVPCMSFIGRRIAQAMNGN